MSLRTRLIIAFLLLSVVPLTAVTLLSYGSSVRAFERAAEREARESASDVSRRMELLTADLGRRIDRLFLAGTPAGGSGGRRPDPELMRESVAPMLGETAALLDRVEFQPAAEADADGGDVRTPPPPPPPPMPGRHAGGRRGAHPPVPPPVPGGPDRPLPGGGEGRGSGRGRGAPPRVIVMDVPAIVQEAMRAAATASAAAAGSSAAAGAASGTAATAGAAARPSRSNTSGRRSKNSSAPPSRNSSNRSRATRKRSRPRR